MVEAFVEHRPEFPHLGEVVAVEVREPGEVGVGDVDVGQAPAGQLVHPAPVGLHPGAEPQLGLRGHWDDRHLAGAGAVGLGPHGEDGLLAGGVLEEAVDVLVALEGLPVDGQQEVALLDVHAGHRQGCLEPGVPVLPAVDPGELVAALDDPVVRAQQTHAQGFLPGRVAAPDEGVADHQPPGHLLEEPVEILAAADARQEGLVEPLRPGQVEAVVVGVVEEVPLDAPHLAVHLAPFGRRIHLDPHGLQRQGALAGLGRLVAGREEPLALPCEEQLRAVRGHAEGGHAPVRGPAAIDPLRELLRLPGLQVEAGDLGRNALEFEALLVREGRGDRGEEQDAGGARLQSGVVGQRQRQADDALIQAVEVDPHGLRIRLVRLLPVALLRARAVLVLVRSRGRLLVALRRHGRGQVLPENRRIDALADGMAQAGHVQPARRQARIRARQEVEVLAAAVEARGGGIAHPVGDPVRLAVRQVADEDRMQVVRQLLGVGEPAAVRRPGGIEVADRGVVEIGVDLHRHGMFQVHDPEVQALVRVGDLPAVGRPAGAVEIGGRLAEVDRPHRAQPIRGTQVEGVFAGRVREPGHPLPVGRPGGVAVRDAGAAGEVPGVPLLGGHGEDLAPRLEQGPLPAGGQGRVEDLTGLHLLEVGAALRQVRREGDRHPGGLPGGEVVEVQGAELVVDDAAGSGGGRDQVEPVGVGEDLADGLRRGVVGVERDGALAVRKEIDRAAHPHGIAVVGILPGDADDAGIGEVGDPEAGRLAAPVVLPRRLPLVEGRVGEVGPVRRVAGLVAGGQGQGLRQPARGRHGEELGQIPGGRPGGAEDHSFAVRRPAEDLVRSGMVGEPQGFTTLCGHHIDIVVAVVAPRVGEAAAVRRVDGMGAAPGPRHDPAGLPALPGHVPDLPGVIERDAGAGQGRMLQEQRHLPGLEDQGQGQDEQRAERHGGLRRGGFPDRKPRRGGGLRIIVQPGRGCLSAARDRPESGTSERPPFGGLSWLARAVSNRRSGAEGG